MGEDGEQSYEVTTRVSRTRRGSDQMGHQAVGFQFSLGVKQGQSEDRVTVRSYRALSRVTPMLCIRLWPGILHTQFPFTGSFPWRKAPLSLGLRATEFSSKSPIWRIKKQNQANQ